MSGISRGRLKGVLILVGMLTICNLGACGRPTKGHSDEPRHDESDAPHGLLTIKAWVVGIPSWRSGGPVYGFAQTEIHNNTNEYVSFDRVVVSYSGRFDENSPIKTLFLVPEDDRGQMEKRLEYEGRPSDSNNESKYYVFKLPPHTYIRLGSLKLDPEVEGVTLHIAISLNKGGDIQMVSHTYALPDWDHNPSLEKGDLNNVGPIIWITLRHPPLPSFQ